MVSVMWMFDFSRLAESASSFSRLAESILTFSQLAESIYLGTNFNKVMQAFATRCFENVTVILFKVRILLVFFVLQPS